MVEFLAATQYVCYISLTCSLLCNSLQVLLCLCPRISHSATVDQFSVFCVGGEQACAYVTETFGWQR
jgi:hypothetical protein